MSRRIFLIAVVVVVVGFAGTAVAEPGGSEHVERGDVTAAFQARHGLKLVEGVPHAAPAAGTLEGRVVPFVPGAVYTFCERDNIHVAVSFYGDYGEGEYYATFQDAKADIEFWGSLHTFALNGEAVEPTLTPAKSIRGSRAYQTAGYIIPAGELSVGDHVSYWSHPFLWDAIVTIVIEAHDEHVH